jgi:hypothetical protein
MFPYKTSFYENLEELALILVLIFHEYLFPNLGCCTCSELFRGRKRGEQQVLEQEERTRWRGTSSISTSTCAGGVYDENNWATFPRTKVCLSRNVEWRRERMHEGDGVEEIMEKIV